MVLFSILFLFAYPIRPYTAKGHIAGPGYEGGLAGYETYVGGPLGLQALFQVLNISDLIKAIVVAPMRLRRGRAMLKGDRADAADHGLQNKAYGG